MYNNTNIIYPIEPWTITETAFDIQNNYRNETTFALSNGYIGTRGTYDEGYSFSLNEGLEGNFVNGFYESEKIRYGEWNYGFPENSQSLLNLPNLKTIQLYVADELFDMRTGVIEDYRRTLYMKDGIVTRHLLWTSPKGRKVKIKTDRLVSLVRKNVMAIRFCVCPLNFAGEIKLVSVLDGDVENHTRLTNPLVDYGPYGRHLTPVEIEAGNECLYYQGRTLNSGLGMACASRHFLQSTTEHTLEFMHTQEERKAFAVVTCQAAQMKDIVLDKFIVYTTCQDMQEEKMKGFIIAELNRAEEAGWETLKEEQKSYIKRFWEMADIQIEGDHALQQGLRFNLFHIMQSAGRDGKTGMGAKGLSGEGYEGHYFWDTEIYIMPVFVYTFPELAKCLLDYRYEKLEQARAQARILGHEKGAMYPWRTINGEEASTYLPLGTAQYHITADVAYAFSQYVSATGDYGYLKEKAAEVLCETARIWADVGIFSKVRDGKYCICAVTGPDEYTAFVDNNFYTNLMAQQNLYDAIKAVKWMEENAPMDMRKLRDKLDLERDEVELWQRVADNMYFPYDEEEGVYLQDDGFWMRKEWDDEKIPSEKRHLLYENYHPLFLWRQRMAKQADSILGMHLHCELFTKEELARNYDFYQKVTLHHSSLSTCVFGIVAGNIGRHEEAYQYFMESARMDLDDYHNNFYAGIHAANMAGTWKAIVNGFAGLYTKNGTISLSPNLPQQWQKCTFHIGYHGRKLEIVMKKTCCEVKLLNGQPLEINVHGTTYHLQREEVIRHEKI